mgnify:CR=1 FL=1
MTGCLPTASFFFANEHFIRNPLNTKGLRGHGPRKSLIVNNLGNF